jgi:Rps23 Pro-64 3,4-dihydroxylase Tpa1-like proline 4-hydroxylase
MRSADTDLAYRSEPFPHISNAQVIPHDLAEATLEWMESSAPWKLRVESFYEQWEIHLSNEIIPVRLQDLISAKLIDGLVDLMLRPIAKGPLELIEVTAHKLVSGQTIRIHNDFADGGETYRLLVQLNRGWTDEQGGLLMLFGGPNPDDIKRAIRPLSGSGFAFEISPVSFHAVSKIRSGERFTLVYSFRRSQVQ